MAILKPTNIMIAGVGGQGNRTLMKIIASAALEDHNNVRVLSSGSLGRLGNSITCHIRLGPSVSATIPIGETDILVALEMNEALRAIPIMRQGSLAFIHTHRRIPIIAGIQGMDYPTMKEIGNLAASKVIKSIFVPESLFLLDNTIEHQSTNSIMLGIFCSYTELFPRSLVEQALCQCLPPQFTQQNLHTFAIGWQHGERLRRPQ
jgi:indolepyruvate ferredoxin oxidoreductase beta subunit